MSRTKLLFRVVGEEIPKTPTRELARGCARGANQPEAELYMFHQSHMLRLLRTRFLLNLELPCFR
ncbi:hypothetical protein H5410_003751 [Solanum commersonii]|uniref:Uncharacterized protein n=1 Tax=Solanum commersonii TaxID=4109 RepID=A0A9J6B600_SOLCO|nr:hypothetical protein H5410_003751 [Solanum commersonii]